MADVRRKARERKKKVQYASPVRKRRRHKQKAHHMSSSTSSSGKMHLLATFKVKSRVLETGGMCLFGTKIF